jgi:hypothetical protein
MAAGCRGENEPRITRVFADWRDGWRRLFSLPGYSRYCSFGGNRNCFKWCMRNLQIKIRAHQPYISTLFHPWFFHISPRKEPRIHESGSGITEAMAPGSRWENEPRICAGFRGLAE